MSLLGLRPPFILYGYFENYFDFRNNFPHIQNVGGKPNDQCRFLTESGG